MRDKALSEIRKVLEAGVIEPATSEWASPIVLVPKKDGSLRFCVDHRRFIAKTVADAYPLARIDDCPVSLGNAEIFKTLDCNAIYWQVPVAPRRPQQEYIHLVSRKLSIRPYALRIADVASDVPTGFRSGSDGRRA